MLVIHPFDRSAPGTVSPGSPQRPAALAIAAIVVAPRSVDLVRSDGVVVTSISYSEPLSVFIAKLKPVLGEHPKRTTQNENLGRPSAATWTGFTVLANERPNSQWRVRVEVSATRSNGIPIATAAGAAVGQSFARLARNSALVLRNSCSAFGATNDLYIESGTSVGRVAIFRGASSTHGGAKVGFIVAPTTMIAC
jgi:hypothetical protein